MDNRPDDSAPSLHDSLTDTHYPSKPSGSGEYNDPTAQHQDPQQYEESAAGPSESKETVPAQSGHHVAPISDTEAADAFVQAENGVEVAGLNELDDGYETSDSAASTSLASSAREFIYENGRRYHSFRRGAYLFPNDDREQDREDLKHAMFLKLFNKQLHFAPIAIDGANVIDLGTGTGKSFSGLVTSCIRSMGRFANISSDSKGSGQLIVRGSDFQITGLQRSDKCVQSPTSTKTPTSLG